MTMPTRKLTLSSCSAGSTGEDVAVRMSSRRCSLTLCVCDGMYVVECSNVIWCVGAFDDGFKTACIAV